jgi:hypothetical protein
MPEKRGTRGITLQAAVSEQQRCADEINERGDVKTADGTSNVLQSTEVDQSLIENAVHFINEKANELVYSGYEQIGRYLLERFFNNDIILASSRSPRKPASYSALCRREDLSIHPARLGVMVRVAAQEEFFASEKLPSEKLSYTHKAELVKLPDNPQKIELARECVTKSISSRELAEKVSKILETMRRDPPVALKLLASKISDPKRLFADTRIVEMLSHEERLEAQLKGLSRKKRMRLCEAVEGILDESKEWVWRFELLRSKLEHIARVEELKRRAL